MLEYWAQVELYRAMEAGDGGIWSHVGSFEHPYHTELPRSGSKTKTKWIDLVLAEPDIARPKRVVWIELKDIGRNHATLKQNAKGLGHDLAALWAMAPARTKDIWLKPLPHTMDRGRLAEWNTYGPNIDSGSQLIAQVVLCHKMLAESAKTSEVQKLWLEAFTSRCKDYGPANALPVAISDTKKFHVFALVARLSRDS